MGRQVQIVLVVLGGDPARVATAPQRTQVANALKGGRIPIVETSVDRRRRLGAGTAISVRLVLPSGARTAMVAGGGLSENQLAPIGRIGQVAGRDERRSGRKEASIDAAAGPVAGQPGLADASSRRAGRAFQTKSVPSSTLPSAGSFPAAVIADQGTAQLLDASAARHRPRRTRTSPWARRRATWAGRRSGP